MTKKFKLYTTVRDFYPNIYQILGVIDGSKNVKITVVFVDVRDVKQLNLPSSYLNTSFNYVSLENDSKDREKYNDIFVSEFSTHYTKELEDKDATLLETSSINLILGVLIRGKQIGYGSKGFRLSSWDDVIGKLISIRHMDIVMDILSNLNSPEYKYVYLAEELECGPEKSGDIPTLFKCSETVFLTSTATNATKYFVSYLNSTEFKSYRKGRKNSAIMVRQIDVTDFDKRRDFIRALNCYLSYIATVNY